MAKKVLIIITKGEVGGAQMVALNLALGLKNQGVAVTVGIGDRSFLSEELDRHGIPAVIFPHLRRSLNPGNFFRAFWEIKKFLNKNYFDTIQINSSNALVAAKAARFSRAQPQVIFTWHGLSYLDPGADKNWLVKKIVLLTFKTLLRFVHKNIFVCQTNLAQAKKIGLIKTGAVIFNEAHTAPYSKDEARKFLAAKLQTDLNNKIIIGSVGRLAYPKNYEYFIQEMKFIVEKYPNAVGIIIGDGPERQKYEQLIRQNHLEQNFFLAGAIPLAGKYLTAFDVFALCSKYEGVAITLLEAKQIGLPILASNTGGTPEILNGYGFLFELKPRALAEAFAAKFSAWQGQPVAPLPAAPVGAMAKEYLKIINEKKKILHLISGLEIGGAEMMLYQVLPKLTDFNHLVCSLSTTGPIGEKLKNLGIKVYALETGRNFSLSAIIKFRQIIKNEEPDIIQTRLIHADIFGRIFGRLFGIRKILCHLESILDEPKYDKLFLLERLTAGLVSRYSAVSAAVKNKYVRAAKLNPTRIQIIYNGIDLNKFVNLPDKPSAKAALGFNDADFLVGYAAKMRPERNHANLIRAFALLATRLPQTKLILAGDGPEKEKLVQLAKELRLGEKVFFLGNRNDVPQILAALNIFVSPSAYEGMSVAILEAMAAGLPIIASDIAPNHELIENGVNGFLVNQTHPEAIAEKIEFLSAHPETRQLFKTAAQEKAKQFSLEKTVDGFNKIYQL